jgi:hypothetical protein
MEKILLTQGKFAIVDDENFEWLNQWKWCCDAKGYAVRHEQKSEYGNRQRKMVKMHRAIMKVSAGIYLDHINRNRLDNRKANLRIATNSQNQANAKQWQTNTSGYRGVVQLNKNKPYNISKPWGAQIVVEGKRIFKGMFETPEEASKAYGQLAKKYFGEYANLNRIGGSI